MNAKALWAAFADGDPRAREQLLNEHIGLVHHVARQVARSVSTEAELDDMISAGTLGLISALESFDYSRGHSFSTFAVPRIRGAILDEFRRQDHASRPLRKKQRDITQARETLMREIGRRPTEPEVARHLNIDLPTLHRWASDVEAIAHVSLDSSRSPTEPGVHPGVAALLAEEDDAPGRLEREEQLSIVRAAIRSLGDQERTVMALHYYEELTLTQVGQVLGLSPSRISQVHSRALRKIQIALSGLSIAV